MSKIDPGDLLDKGIDFDRRRIYFGAGSEGEFNWDSVELAVKAIERMEAAHPKTPINLIVNSSGGEVYQMLRLYDAIQRCSCQVRFFGVGEVYSAATWIMAGCDERWLDPNTCVMLHAGHQTGTDQTFTDLQIDNEEYQKLMRKLMELFADNSRLPVEFWEEICQRDTYLTAEETILLGLADRITEPKKRGNLRKARTHALRQAPDKKDLNKLIKSIYKRIYKGRQLTKIEVQIQAEEFDKDIIVDPTPLVTDPTPPVVDPAPPIVLPVEKNTLNNPEEELSSGVKRDEQM